MRTLVLNAGYEPLAVVTFRRALLLVLTGKASILAEDNDDPVVGPREILSRPTVILLNRYVRVPYREAAHVTRRGILRRDSHRCAYCGRTATTVDHVHPRSLGGEDSWENLVACCLTCNNKKGNKTLRQMGWSLPRAPYRPVGPQWYITELEKPAPSWNAFLDVHAA